MARSNLSSLRLPTFGLALLSICLSVAIIGCAGRTLNLFNTQQSTNAWLLPLWPQHFDTRGLQALIGISASVLVLDALLVVAVLIPANWSSIATLVSAALSFMLALIALIFPVVLNNQAPTYDTLQTWTCQWGDTTMEVGQGAPSQFTSMCRESRFAYFTTIPVFLIQLLLLGLAGHSLFSARSRPQDAEKGQELGSVDHGPVSYDAKSERSVRDSLRLIGNKEVQYT